MLGLGHVHLADLGARDGADVLDREGDVPLGGLEVGVLEGGVGEAVAKGVGHGDTGGLVVAVAHEDALAILARLLLGGEAAGGGRVLETHGPGLSELARGVDLAGHDVECGARARLAAERAVHDRLGVRGPARLD